MDNKLNFTCHNTALPKYTCINSYLISKSSLFWCLKCSFKNKSIEDWDKRFVHHVCIYTPFKKRKIFHSKYLCKNLSSQLWIHPIPNCHDVNKLEPILPQIALTKWMSTFFQWNNLKKDNLFKIFIPPAQSLKCSTFQFPKQWVNVEHMWS